MWDRAGEGSRGRATAAAGAGVRGPVVVREGKTLQAVRAALAGWEEEELEEEEEEEAVSIMI